MWYIGIILAFVWRHNAPIFSRGIYGSFSALSAGFNSSETSMSDETLQVQLAPPKNPVDFAFFSADNKAAIHLLDLIKVKTSLLALISNKETIGFQLLTYDSKDFWLISAGLSYATPNKNSHYKKPDILLYPPGKSYSANIAR